MAREPKRIAPSDDVAEAAPTNSQSRVYKSTQTVDHDLFKLKVAKMIKNAGYNEEAPLIQAIEHTHFFHTVDSSGKRQTTSTATGGHHHSVVVVQGPNGVPTLEVSGPMRWVKKKSRGQWKRIEEPVTIGKGDGAEADNHAHEVEYCGSERITLRKPNMEFAKVEATLKARYEPPTVEGVISG